MSRERVGVVGAGVSGLTAAHLLSRAHDVVLFEGDDRLGGHAHTHDVRTADGRVIAVDSGFIVHNSRTYPQLLRLFRELGVSTRDTEMSMSVRCRGCGLEYAGAKRLGGLFPRAQNVRDLRYLRTLSQVRRFHREAGALLDRPRGDARTLAEFLTDGRYSRHFTEHFAIPLVSAVWSAGPATSGRYPARYLFEFLRHHGMLSIGGSPTWRTVIGGSREYVLRIGKQLQAVRTATPVRSVRRLSDRVEVRSATDEVHEFDRVVVATHADQALRLLDSPTAAQRRALGAFEYSENATLLHTDASVLPSSRGARASWNYLKNRCADVSGGARISYDMNRLMGLAEPVDHVVTLNGGSDVDSRRVLAEMRYRHPIYTPDSVAAQAELPSIGDERVRFAGAYHGWGFHEDGCASGVRAAAAFGAGW
ncbi:FAD-dependent oxidoreductase [Saccharopolyspora sp. TS4A08]|uniref:FAD-dependent oxidoreductase n=1 Tax=Saccharopolyspora ipomoeae TaxID=3042027 RepID=A0ABT6PMK1_9PSEU|nr:FAD-dependent oxidoreductase [Saccharopolyspora sp. TS4A08]MDI2028883.1 FAD-dependent oxidoreductase [Saccharopolyspora sp. TS4A08]